MGREWSRSQSAAGRPRCWRPAPASARRHPPPPATAGHGHGPGPGGRPADDADVLQPPRGPDHRTGRRCTARRPRRCTSTAAPGSRATTTPAASSSTPSGRRSPPRGSSWCGLDYRLGPTQHWPDQIEDVKCAIRYLRANARRLQHRPGRRSGPGARAPAATSSRCWARPGVRRLGRRPLPRPVEHRAGGGRPGRPERPA